jgi:hypothetical protein
VTTNPDHLLEQAERLLASPRPGPPRQADLRRSISTAYYALFNFILRAVADEFVGAGRRSSARYALLYRSIDHRALREVCVESARQRASNRYAPYVPEGGFDPNILTVAAAVVELQSRRHAADYNPLTGFSAKDAELAVEAARRAVRRFGEADGEHRRMFLTLLLCPPRQG